jgi:hypothetical protein
VIIKKLNEKCITLVSLYRCCPTHSLAYFTWRYPSSFDINNSMDHSPSWEANSSSPSHEIPFIVRNTRSITMSTVCATCRYPEPYQSTPPVRGRCLYVCISMTKGLHYCLQTQYNLYNILIFNFIIMAYKVIFCMFGWPRISNYIRIMNQHDATYFTLFRYHASTCFARSFSTSSGGQVYNVAMVLIL